jgi:hypothetical protein
MAIIGTLIKTSKYGGIAIDEYQGKFSIMSAWETREGEIKPNFVKTLPKNKDEEGKIVPVKILIGDSRAEAIDKLKCLIEILAGADDKPEDDDSIPF